MNKIFALLSGLFIGFALLFSGCGDIYKGMKMDIVGDKEITIFIEDEIDKQEDSKNDAESTQTENSNIDSLVNNKADSTVNNSEDEKNIEFINTAEIKVKISGVGDKVVKNIVVSSSDISKLRVESNVLNKGESLITVRAIQTGRVALTIQSAEGGLTQIVNVNIIKKTTKISFKNDYKFAVMANGVPYKIDETQLVQEPIGANSSEFTYSLAQEVEGVTLNNNGEIIVENKTVDSFLLQVRPKYAKSEEVFTQIEIPIYNAINSNNLQFFQTKNEENIAIENNLIEIIKNQSTDNNKIISFKMVNNSKSSEIDEYNNLKIEASVADESLAMLDESNQTVHSIMLVGVNNGKTTLNVKVYFREFPNIIVYSNAFDLIVKDVATFITVDSHTINSQDNSIDIYNLTDINNVGQELIIKVFPDTAENRKFKFEIASEYLDVLKITNISGFVYDLSKEEFRSGQKLYFSHNASLINKSIVIKIVAVDSQASVEKNLTLNLLLNVESIECDSNMMFVFDDDYFISQKINYSLLPKGASNKLVSIVSSNADIANVVYDGVKKEHYIIPRAVGKLKLMFYVDYKILKIVNIEIAKEFKNLLVNIDSPQQNPSVSNRVQESVYYDDKIVGENTTSAVIKIEKNVKINVESYPKDAKFTDVSYKIVALKDENGQEISTDSVHDVSNGYVLVDNVVEAFAIKVSAYGYVYNSETQKMVKNEKPIELIIEFKSILPISRAELNAKALEVYDIDTVGYAEKELAQKKLILEVSPKNATINAKNVVWSVDKKEYENILKRQDDGSLLVEGKLPANAGNQQTVNIRATIKEYDMIISRECRVTIKRAKQVENILISGYDRNRGVYMKCSTLADELFIPDQYQINATPMPLDAMNPYFDYFAFDITKDNGAGDDWFSKGQYSKVSSTRIKVGRDGLVSTTNKNKNGGYSIVYVVARDNIKEEGVFVENDIKKRIILLFKIADGESVPYEIYNVRDFLDIDKSKDAGKKYVLANNIDLSGIKNYRPIGTENNPFSASLNGEYKFINSSKQPVRYSIINYHYNISQITQNDLVSQKQFYGLFGYVSASGKIENLDIQLGIMNFNMLLSDDFTFGAVAAINKGEIKNCKITLNNDVNFTLSQLDNNVPFVRIGMLCGVNYGKIDDNIEVASNSVVNANGYKITIKNNSVSIDDYIINDIEQGFLGGLVGQNLNFIGGKFIYRGDYLNSDNINIEFNVNYNDANTNSNVVVNNEIPKFVVGGVVGINSQDAQSGKIGMVRNVSFGGELKSFKNVGGVIGINQGNANELLSFGKINIINSKNEIALENIGGVVGHNMQGSTINFALFEVYDATTHIYIESQNASNIGGVVGLNDGIIYYSYSNSYSVHKENNTNFDMIINGQTLSNIGAFVGNNGSSGKITTSFAVLALKEDLAGATTTNFVGLNNGDITDCYSMGYINFQTTPNQTQIGYSNANNWTAGITGRNFGFPMLKITTHENEVLLTESPKELNVVANNYEGKMKVNRFYKVDDKKMILFYNNMITSKNGDQEIDDSFNEYLLKDLFDIQIIPLSERTKSLSAEVIKGNSIIILGNRVITKSQGYAVIRIASQIDKNICNDIEVYVTNGVTNIEIDNVKDNKLSMFINDNIELKLNNKNRIQPSNEANEEFSALNNGGWIYQVASKDYISFDYQQIDEVDNNKIYVESEYIQLLKALKATSDLNNGSLQINIYPYANIKFGENEAQKFVFDNIEFVLNLKIYEGLKSIDLSKSNEQIMPSVSSALSVNLYTDLSTDFIQEIVVYDENKKVEIGIYTITFDGDNYEINYLASGDEKKKVDLEIIGYHFYNAEEVGVNNQKMLIDFQLTPKKEIGYFETQNHYSYTFSANSQSGKTYEKVFNLIVNPQEINNVTIQNYNDGKVFDPTLTGAGEVESNYIVAGQNGLLVINLHPDYSVYSNLTLESAIIDGEYVALQQVYYNPKNDNYAEKVESSNLIEKGITLSRLSNRYKDKGHIITEFNGKIYVKTLLSSYVKAGASVTLTLKAYMGEETNPIYIKTKDLITQNIPYVNLELGKNTANGMVAKGTTFEFIVDYETNSELILNLYRITDTKERENLDFSTTEIEKVEGNKTTKTIKVGINPNFYCGETYYIEAIVTKNNSMQTQYGRAQIKFKVVDFIITSIDIVDANNLEEPFIVDGKLSRPLNNQGWKLLCILNAIYSTDCSENVKRIQNLINSKLANEPLYQLWWYNNSLSQDWRSITANKEYPNFKMEHKKSNVGTTDGGWTLFGRTIANVDTLKAMIEYKYNEDGQLTLCEPTKGDFNKSIEFKLDFSLSSSKDNPLPIYNESDFLNMEKGVDYILLKDLKFNGLYKPLATEISSLDGNGYTITLENVDFDFVNNKEAKQIGLFSKVSSQTILKNINLLIQINGLQSEIDLTKSSNVSFGYLAGINEGVITNCHVYSLQTQKSQTKILTSLSSKESQVEANIGGLVGKNDGVITNSRVSNCEFIVVGTMGGLCGVNNKTIGACSTVGVKITSNGGDVGGLVALNNLKAKINTSFVKGEWSEINSNSIRSNILAIGAVGNIGGFVYENFGSINDCYSNLKIRSQARSGGFVYNNGAEGEIENCISYSDVIQNNIAHMPFVATNSSDLFCNEGKIQNSFFYMEETDVYILKDLQGKESGAQRVNALELANPQLLRSFAFNDFKSQEDIDSEFNGVWVIPNNTTMKDSANVYKYFVAENGFQLSVPELVDANILAKSRRKLDETKIVDGLPVYIYSYFVGEDNDAKFYALGDIFNPYLVADVDDFIYAFEQKELNDGLKKHISSSVRLIKDISFENYDERLQTSKVNYSGIFNGNGLELRKVSLVSELNNMEQNFGLFSALRCTHDIRNKVVNRGVIKNLNIEFIEVKASQTPIVGSVAGVVDGGFLANIKVYGDNVAVKGNNIVGGVAGLVKGSSRLFNLESSLSVNAGFRNNSEYKSMVYCDEGILITNDETTLNNENILISSVPYVSYAGAVVGVLDTKLRDLYQENMRLISAYGLSAIGNIKVVGSTVGGVFGMVGINSYVSNAKFIVSVGQFISGYHIAGGVVGEHRGKIEESYIAHEKEIQKIIDATSLGVHYDKANINLFKENESQNTVGGLIGFNFGGIILNSYAKVDVRNSKANSAGGLVGANLSGDIRAVFASGSVCANMHIGGLIGEIISVVLPKGKDYNSFFNKKYLPKEMFGDKSVSLINFNCEDYDTNTMTMSYVVAGNNWLIEDSKINQANIGEASKNWGGIIGYYPKSLSKTYITTLHPQNSKEEENYINFYVKYERNNVILNSAIGNDKDKYIASDINYGDLNNSNKIKYFGKWFRYIWDLSEKGKFPELNVKAVPNYIEINDKYDLMQMNWKLDGNFVLKNDIDLKDLKQWLPIGTNEAPFTGKFNSQVKSFSYISGVIHYEYFTIKNLSIMNKVGNCGLFGVTGMREIMKENKKIFIPCSIQNINLTIKNIDSLVYSESEISVGGLIGKAQGTIIHNCTVRNSNLANDRPCGIKTNSDYVGGLVGYATDVALGEGFLQTQDKDGKLSEPQPTNGSRYSTKISNSVALVDIYLTENQGNSLNDSTSISYVGGFIGYMNQNVEITNCWSEQDIKFVNLNNESEALYNNSFVIGGFVGSSANLQGVIIDSSFSNSRIINDAVMDDGMLHLTIGGFVGAVKSSLAINYCFSAGELIMKPTNNVAYDDIFVLGGFAGEINGTINNNYSIVTFNNYVKSSNIGGFVGKCTNSREFDKSNNYYDEMVALLDRESLGYKTSNELVAVINKNMNDDVNSKWISGNAYYPLIKSTLSTEDNALVLGKDRLDIQAFEGMDSGSKINPIIIKNIETFDEMVKKQEKINNSVLKRYVYYIQTENIDLSSCEIFSESDKNIANFYGFYNGNGLELQNFTMKFAPNIYNIGLFGNLKADSIITGVNLVNVEIDIRSQKAIQVENGEIKSSKSEILDTELNVGGIAGNAELNTRIHASTVKGNISCIPYGEEQTLNIGGIIGKANATNIIYCASYVDISSFDYRLYNGVSDEALLKAETLNIGAIVGNYEGNSRSVNLISNVYSLGEIHYTNGLATSVGNLLGRASYVTIDNYYAVNNIFNAKDNIISNVGYVGKNSDHYLGNNQMKTNLEEISDPNLSKNYGYQTFNIIKNTAISTELTIIETDVTKINYYKAVNIKQLEYLLKNNKNIYLDKDIYADETIVTVDNYVPVNNDDKLYFNGNNKTIHNLNKALIKNVDAIIKNTQFISADTYVNPYIFGTITGESKIENVLASDLDLFENVNAADYDNNDKIKYSAFKGYTTKSKEIESKDPNVATKWMNLGNGDTLRDFVEYWDSMDLRCVFINTEKYQDKDISGQDKEVDALIINDKYQLSKLNNLTSLNSNFIDGKVVLIKNTEDFDLSGMIWNGLGYRVNLDNFKIIGETKSLSNNITIKNLYSEGITNVGFVSSASNVVIKNINFENSKLALLNDSENSIAPTNFGIVAGYGEDLVAENINISGIIDINVPTASYVGGAFGKVVGDLNSIKMKGTSKNLEESKITGRDIVGGIVGEYLHKNDETSDKLSGGLYNNYNVLGHDFVGGFFGVILGNSSTYFNGVLNGDITTRQTNEVDFLNSGNVSGNNFVGGIVGVSKSKMNLVLNVGTVQSRGCYVGGLIGYNNSIIRNSLNFSSVSALRKDRITYPKFKEKTPIEATLQNLKINLSEINDKFIHTTTNMEGYFFGGVSGVNNGLIATSQNLYDNSENQNGKAATVKMSVSAKSFVGGITGINLRDIDGEINISSSDSYKVKNTATIIGDSFVGGICGYNAKDGNIKSVSNESSMQAKLLLGGITGYNDGWILHASALKVSSEDEAYKHKQTLYLGGISGYNDSNGIIQSVNMEMNFALKSIIDSKSDGNINTLFNVTGVASLQNLNSDEYYVGGITSINKGMILTSVVKEASFTREPNFEYNLFMGGIVAENSGKIKNTFIDSNCSILFQYSDDDEKNINGVGVDHKNVTIQLGGVVAINAQNSLIENCYSLAKIEVSEVAPNSGRDCPYKNLAIGGVAAKNCENAIINNSYSLGKVVGISEKQENKPTMSYSVEVQGEHFEVANDEVVNDADNTADNTANNQEQYLSFMHNNFRLDNISVFSNNTNENIFTAVEIDGQIIYKVDKVTYDIISTNGIWSSSNPSKKCIVSGTYGIIDNGTYGIIDSENKWFEANGTIKENAKFTYNDFYNAFVIIIDQTIDNTKESKDKMMDSMLSVPAIHYLSWTKNFMPVSNVVSDIQKITKIPLLSSGFDGSGTIDNPYKLSSVASLQTIQFYLERSQSGNDLDKKEDFKGKYFELTNDIDLHNSSLIIGTQNTHFNGILNGNNYAIKNLNNTYSGDNVGLFDILGINSAIKNLRFASCSASADNNVGIVAGINYGGIENVRVINSDTDKKVVSGKSNIGGIVGINKGIIIKCQSAINVEGVKNIGGIAGNNENIISQCESIQINKKSFNINGETNVGGIVGLNGYFVDQCVNHNAICNVNSTVTRKNIGGICGEQKINSTSKSSTKIGGLYDCINYGVVNGIDNNYYGGIIGNIISGNLNRVISIGTINISTSIGGFIYGQSSSTSKIDNLFYDSTLKLDSNSKSISNNGAKALSRNQLKDAVRVESNFNIIDENSFDFGFNKVKASENQNAVWGFTPVSIQSTDYVGNYVTLRNLPSSENKEFLKENKFNGNGTKATPYLIENIEQFKLFADLINNSNEDIQNYYNTAQCYSINTSVWSKDYNYNVAVTSFTFEKWKPLQDIQCHLESPKNFTINLGTVDKVKRGDTGEYYSGFTTALVAEGQIYNLTFNITSLDETANYVGGVAGWVYNPHYVQNENGAYIMIINNVKVVYGKGVTLKDNIGSDVTKGICVGEAGTFINNQGVKEKIQDKLINVSSEMSKETNNSF